MRSPPPPPPALCNQQRRARGNILFLILLAVVLFAALSYAVTESLRNGGKDSTSERAQSQASELANYFTQIDTAVQRMMMIDNVKDYQLNFFYGGSSNFVMGSNDNPNCTESRCRVFDPAGGNVSGKKINGIYSSDTGSNRQLRIFYLSIPNVGTNLPDIVAAIYKARPRLCEAVNQQAGLPGIVYLSGTFLETNALMYHNAIPTGPIPDTTQTFSSIPDYLANHGTFCVCIASTEAGCIAQSWYPIILHVIVER